MIPTLSDGDHHTMMTHAERVVVVHHDATGTLGVILLSPIGALRDQYAITPAQAAELIGAGAGDLREEGRLRLQGTGSY
jgi:hypothetical protein